MSVRNRCISLAVSIMVLLFVPTAYAQKMLWNEPDTRSIKSADRDGTAIQNVVTLTSPNRVEGFDVDTVLRQVYWASGVWGEDGARFERADFDGTQRELLLADSYYRPLGLVVDSIVRRMYWPWYFDMFDGIMGCSLDGSDWTSINPSGMYTLGVPAVDPIGEKVYWISTDFSSSRIRRANLDGSQSETIVTTSVEEEPHVLRLDPGAGMIYWTCGDFFPIRRARLDGSNVEILDGVGGVQATSLVLHPAQGKMYWADPLAGKIQRADLDGSNLQDLIDTGLTEPKSLAIDTSEGKMYWADSGTGKIQRANLDGTSVEDLVTGLTSIETLLLDVEDPVAPPIPTLSAWGMLVLSCLVAIAGSVVIRRQRQAGTATNYS